MSSKSLTPHDHFFKSSLQNAVVTHDFFEAHLPTSIKERIKLPSLHLCNNAFIDKQFKQRFSDVIYTAEIDNKRGYLYLLAEHQSTPDPLMPFRVLHYQCQILQRHIEQHKNTSI